MKQAKNYRSKDKDYAGKNQKQQANPTKLAQKA